MRSADYPVKTYELPFHYTVETHSGGSWMYLIYILREVYKGNITYEEVVTPKNVLG